MPMVWSAILVVVIVYWNEIKTLKKGKQKQNNYWIHDRYIGSYTW